MPNHNQQPQSNLYDPKQTLLWGLAFVNMLAGVYRAALYIPGTPGSRAVDRWTWIGVVFAFPLFVTFWPPAEPAQHRHAYQLWLALLALTFLHSSAAFWSWADRHSLEVGRPIFGRLDVPAGLLAALAAFASCGPGAGLFLASAQMANLIQLGLIRARFRRMAALRRDAEIEAGIFRSYTN